MGIIIVAGPTCSGKSTFIKNNFPKHTKIDVFDFQQKPKNNKNFSKNNITHIGSYVLK